MQTVLKPLIYKFSKEVEGICVKWKLSGSPAWIAKFPSLIKYVIGYTEASDSQTSLGEAVAEKEAASLDKNEIGDTGSTLSNGRVATAKRMCCETLYMIYQESNIYFLVGLSIIVSWSLILIKSPNILDLVQ